MLGKLGLRQKTVFLKRKRVYTIPITNNKFFLMLLRFYVT